MQRTDLEETVTRTAPRLLQVAAGAQVDHRWTAMFQEHLRRVMKSYTASSQTAKSELDKGLSVLRARYDILEIVHERIVERARFYDPGLVEALTLLHEAQRPILEAALQGQRGAGRHQGSRSPERRGDSGSPSGPSQRVRNSLLLTPTSDKDQTVRRVRLEDDADELASSPNLGSAAVSLRSDSQQLAGSSRPKGRSYSDIHDPRYERERYEKSTGRPGRDMTLEQLRELIRSVSLSKERSNRLRSEAVPRQPLETMEEHLYSCLARRHSDPALVEEWSLLIFRMIQKFAATHSDIAVFGLVLQNRLSETQVLVLNTLKETVRKLLRARLEEGSIPEQDTLDVEGRWQEWQRAGAPLSVCESVVRHLYDEGDSERCLELVRPLAGSPGPMCPEVARVSLFDFREGLLRFQMRLAEFHTSDFLALFNNVGKQDRRVFRGVLTAAQAMQLTRAMAEVPESKERDLVIARAELFDEVARVQARLQDTKSISFTECVDDVFASTIDLRWKARGGLHAFSEDEAEGEDGSHHDEEDSEEEDDDHEEGG